MAITIYDQFVPPFSKMLTNLDNVLTKAEADAEARKIDPSVFVNGRLAPDMLPLVRQVQITTDQAKGGASRLAGQERRSGPTRRRRFADLHARVAKAIAYLKTFKPAQFDGAETRTIELKFPNVHVELHGQGLLAELRRAEFLLPLHDRVRDPAAQRRADRQARLHRRPLRSSGVRRSRSAIWSTAT